MDRFSRLAERQMLKARAEGKLSGLDGEGAPLPDRSAERDAGEAAAYRMMAEAGAVPEEFRIKAALDDARAELARAHGDARVAAQRRVAELTMRYNIAVEARRAFMR